MAPVTGVTAARDLDAERDELIRRNKSMMQQLGLLPLVDSLKKQVVQQEGQANKRQRQTERPSAEESERRATRRSLRAQGKEPDLPALLQPMFGGGAGDAKREPAKRPRTVVIDHSGDTTNAAKFDSHNLHRIRTMSDEQLEKRINKITNTLKMQSLVLVLKAEGRDELAAMAQERLDELLANV